VQSGYKKLSALQEWHFIMPCQEWGQIHSNEGGTAMWQWEGAKQKAKISLTLWESSLRTG